MEGDSIREAVENLFNAINLTQSVAGGPQHKSLDSLFSIMNSIVMNPYVDFYRIVDLTYFKSKFAKVPEAVKLLKEIGFRQGSNTNTFVFGYEQQVHRMMIAKELLASKVVKRHEESTYSNLEEKLRFPFF